MIEFRDPGWVQADLSEEDEFRWPLTLSINGRKREMIVTNVHVSYRYQDGGFAYAWLSGDLVLLNGERSVQSREVSELIDHYDQLPEQVRNALEEREARVR